jgi:hypothetical protein
VAANILLFIAVLLAGYGRKVMEHRFADVGAAGQVPWFLPAVGIVLA